MFGSPFTVIIMLSASPQTPEISYFILCRPTPAELGSKYPPETPLPE